ncbi:hypothetical protein Trydic_g19387 [Trypoxylus dichotomus]
MLNPCGRTWAPLGMCFDLQPSTLDLMPIMPMFIEEFAMISLVKIAADSELKKKTILEVQQYCSSQLVEYPVAPYNIANVASHDIFAMSTVKYAKTI